MIWKNDNFLTNIAGVMALGVAFFPTFPADKGEKIFTLVASDARWLGGFHYSFAAVLFISFSILAINVFNIGQHDDPSIEKSWMNENNIYRFCGYSILVFIGIIALGLFKVKLFKDSTLLFEALSLFAFGTAWLIKGRILGDKGKIGEKIYKERNVRE